MGSVGSFLAQGVRLLLLLLKHPVVQAGISEGLRAAGREVIRRSTSARTHAEGQKVEVNRA